MQKVNAVLAVGSDQEVAKVVHARLQELASMSVEEIAGLVKIGFAFTDARNEKQFAMTFCQMDQFPTAVHRMLRCCPPAMLEAMMTAVGEWQREIIARMMQADPDFLKNLSVSMERAESELKAIQEEVDAQRPGKRH